MILDVPGGSDGITERMQEGQTQRRCDNGSRAVTGLKMEEGTTRQGRYLSSVKPGEERKQISPRASRNNY